ncbi:MAG: M28 family peptidase, partial [Spirochaetales bacterium]
SGELAAECARISREAGTPADTRPIAFLTGGTDAGELARVGVKATTLVGMPWSNSERGAVYHTPSDTTEAVEPEALAAAADILVRRIQEVDAEAAASGD